MFFLLLLFAVAAAQAPHACFTAAGAACGACGPGCEACGPAFTDGPTFHLLSASCYVNDPNAPFYDPLHGLYHLMWQEHVWEPQGGEGGGPTFGHAVSADMVRWTRLPVAVWNDARFDTKGVWTGSATIVDGVPTIVYPALCSPKNETACTPNRPGGDLGFNFAVAVPADHAGDPFLTHWRKPAYNPVRLDSGADPAGAWQTAAGEWRFVSASAHVFTSPDFVTWSDAGQLTGGARRRVPRALSVAAAVRRPGLRASARGRRLCADARLGVQPL
jgi:beta-fructofuranosidase